MLNFVYLEKSLRIVSSPHFVYDFSINSPNLIDWLSLLLEILGNMCIATVCFPGFDIIKFEINLTFLIRLLVKMTKKSRQKFKYLENEKSFQGEIKSIFYHFKRTFSCQKLSQTVECAFKVRL